MRFLPRARSDAIESRTVFSPGCDHQSPTHVVDGHVVDNPAWDAARAKSQHDIVKLPADPWRNTTAASPSRLSSIASDAPGRCRPKYVAANGDGRSPSSRAIWSYASRIALGSAGTSGSLMKCVYAIAREAFTAMSRSST